MKPEPVELVLMLEYVWLEVQWFLALKTAAKSLEARSSAVVTLVRILH